MAARSCHGMYRTFAHMYCLTAPPLVEKQRYRCIALDLVSHPTTTKVNLFHPSTFKFGAAFISLSTPTNTFHQLRLIHFSYQRQAPSNITQHRNPIASEIHNGRAGSSAGGEGLSVIPLRHENGWRTFEANSSVVLQIRRLSIRSCPLLSLRPRYAYGTGSLQGGKHGS